MKYPSTSHLLQRSFIGIRVPLLLGALLCPVFVTVPAAIAHASEVPSLAADAAADASPNPPANTGNETAAGGTSGAGNSTGGNASGGNGTSGTATPTPSTTPAPTLPPPSLLATRPSKGQAVDKSNRYTTRTLPLYFYQDAERLLQDMAGSRIPLRVGDPERIRVAITDLNAAQKAASDAEANILKKQVEKTAKEGALKKAEEDLTKAQNTLDDAKEESKKADTIATESKAAKDAADRQVTLKERELAKYRKRLTVLEAIKPPSTGQQDELAQLRDVTIPKAEDELVELQDKAAEAKTKNDTDNTEKGTKATALKAAQDAFDGKGADKKSASENLETVKTELSTAQKAAVDAFAIANSKAAELEDARRSVEGNKGPLVLLAEPTANDPVERVQVTAERGGLLILHGDRDDLEEAANIVRQLDRPGAQVRAVFWTLQASGAGTKDGRRALQNSSQEMVFHTKLAQDQVATCGATLRDAILLVYEQYSKAKGAFKGSPPSVGSKYPFDFFHPRIVDALNFGNSEEALDREFQPLNLATFGEAAAVVAIAQRSYREQILNQFFAMLPKRLATMEIRHDLEAKRIPPLELNPDLPTERAMTLAMEQLPRWKELVAHYTQTTQFSRLRGFLNYEIRYDPNQPTLPHLDPMRDDLTPIQQEVLRFWAGTKPRLWLSADARMTTLERGKNGQLDLSPDEQAIFASAGYDLDATTTKDNKQVPIINPMLREKILVRREFNRLVGVSDYRGLETPTPPSIPTPTPKPPTAAPSPTTPQTTTSSKTVTVAKTTSETKSQTPGASRKATVTTTKTTTTTTKGTTPTKGDTTKEDNPPKSVIPSPASVPPVTAPPTTTTASSTLDKSARGSDVNDTERDYASKLLREMHKRATDWDLEGLYDNMNVENDPLPGPRLLKRMDYSGRDRSGGALDRRASVAAMDASIRRLMQATEQDLEGQFILPALNRVRESASGKGITLGVVERNSVIAMNRSVARVDPRASYEIQLPAQGNLQKDAVQLATFAMGLGSGNVLTGLNALGQLKPSSIEDTPGTYFVQSGNTIEFTPVVGPDGQSIRMNVRLQRDAPVKMPDREKGQNFARIERHNVNTDVQDTNFEMIEIARFENQTTIAENRQRRGGIPILNQLPIIREIPLVGWFTKNREPIIGQQQSLVFMQTAIYPSIQDLMHLFDEAGADTNR